MSEKDFAIGSVGIPSVGTISKKPCYLVILSDAKGKSFVHFISLDKPESVNGFIQVKGFYSDESEEDIVKGFVDLVLTTKKESILDLMLPIHRVFGIRNLVFNANKQPSLVK